MRPDPDRLGGLAWARRTGGRLTRSERARLLGEIARGQAVNLAGRIKLALGHLPAGAREIDAAGFEPPDSALAREAEQACAEQPATIAGHSYRTWMFGLALAALDRAELDPELFYCASLLHDFGIVEPTAGRDFTLASADRVLACAERPGPPAIAPSRWPTRSACTPRRASGSTATVPSAATSSGARWSTASAFASGTSHPPTTRRSSAAIRGNRASSGSSPTPIRAEARAVPGGRFSLLVRCGFPLAARLAPFET